MATATSPQIRNLFVSVVLFCDVVDLEVLFNRLWRSMYNDIITRFKSSFAMPNLKLFDDELKKYVLYELELLFNVAGTSLKKNKLPMPDGRLLSKIKNKLLREELNYDIVDFICQHSSAFPQLNQCQLNILAIGDGTQQDALFLDDYDASMIKIPPDLLLEPGSNPILAIVLAVYPSIHDINIDPCYFRVRAIVTPRNTTISEINDFILNMLPGMKQIYLSTNVVCKTSSDGDNVDILYLVEFINQLEFNGVPSHTISLRIGIPIMLLRNLNLSASLCNGTRLIVTQLAERVIEAQIITSSFIGNRVFILRIVFPINDAKCPFTNKRRQFPIRPCYAMTINKSQGQSLKVVGVFLKDQVFTHGQLYVALSWVTSRQGLKIITCDAEGNHSIYVKNIVYKDVINSLLVS
ncbi:hypothetical protein D5086_017185 [Populus alba]|uniref:Uncharacterized protein n=1 Tax=Populus alba TaxID=43335 RepID=A0ACC4BW17_POPAL